MAQEVTAMDIRGSVIGCHLGSHPTARTAPSDVGTATARYPANVHATPSVALGYPNGLVGRLFRGLQDIASNRLLFLKLTTAGRRSDIGYTTCRNPRLTSAWRRSQVPIQRFDVQLVAKLTVVVARHGIVGCLHAGYPRGLSVARMAQHLLDERAFAVDVAIAFIGEQRGQFLLELTVTLGLLGMPTQVVAKVE